MQTVFYSTLFLSNREQIFLKSVLVMYNARGNASWSQNNSKYDVVIIGKETSPQEVATIPEHVKVVLSFNPNAKKLGCNFLYVNTPIKATELIETIHVAEKSLIQFSSGSYIEPELPTAEVSQKIRLLQWPKAEVLATDRAYPVLSALLSKCAMTLEELAAISSKPEDICHSFIEQVIHSGDAEYVTTTMIPSVKSVEQKSAPKKGLLDRIRISLGLFQK